MEYDTVAYWSQMTSMFLFIGLFLGILVYVLWPSTRQKLDKAQRRALDLDTNQDQT